MSAIKKYDLVLSAARTDILIATRELESIAEALAKVDVAELENGMKVWRECLTIALPSIEEKYGHSSREADVVRELLASK
ncbi:MAG: hypothetical protein JNL05_12995 [Flavobacteriales bacterium]|nr:hypothetical protein [Flavobacteriales bacterium]